MKNWNTIYILDDDPILTLLLKKLIQKVFDDKIKTQTFDNGKEAITFFLNNKIEGKHILFLDLNMPLMDGWEFLNWVDQHQYDKYFKVYILSSSTAEKDKRIAAQYKFIEDFIEKPLTIKTLLEIFDKKEL